MVSTTQWSVVEEVDGTVLCVGCGALTSGDGCRERGLAMVNVANGADVHVWFVALVVGHGPDCDCLHTGAERGESKTLRNVYSAQPPLCG